MLNYCKVSLNPKMAEKSNPFPTVEETLKHPAYPTAIWKLVPHKKGRAPVAEGRGGPFNIGWEIHGSGPTKLVVSRSRARVDRLA